MADNTLLDLDDVMGQLYYETKRLDTPLRDDRALSDLVASLRFVSNLPKRCSVNMYAVLRDPCLFHILSAGLRRAGVRVKWFVSGPRLDPDDDAMPFMAYQLGAIPTGGLLLHLDPDDDPAPYIDTLGPAAALLICPVNRERLYVPDVAMLPAYPGNCPFFYSELRPPYVVQSPIYTDILYRYRYTLNMYGTNYARDNLAAMINYATSNAPYNFFTEDDVDVDHLLELIRVTRLPYRPHPFFQ